MTDAAFICEDLAAALPAGRVVITGAEAHHLRVKRIEVGETIDVVDGAGLRAHCHFDGFDDEGAHALIDSVSREEMSRPALILVQALIKSGRDQHVVQMATEVGVSGIIAWQAQRSIVRWREAKLGKALRGWNEWAREAAKQSRRATVPEVTFAASVEQVVSELGARAQRIGTAYRPGMGVSDSAAAAADPDGEPPAPLSGRRKSSPVGLLVAHEDATTAIWDLQPQGIGADVLGVVIGPEGGFTEAETEAFVSHGATLVSLGENILRASTAGVVSLTALKCLSSRSRP